MGANKNSIKIIGDHTDKYVQAYFQYDSKKTGGVTISHLRFGDHPIRSPYYINKADFVACHNPTYITKGFKMVNDVKPGGVFMINCQWDFDELNHHLKADAKRYIARNNIQLYTINAIDLAIEIGMGKRNNTILQSAFFSLAKVMPEEDAIRFMKEKAKASYLKKGQDVVDMNYKAIDLGATAYKKIDVPAEWADAVDETEHKQLEGKPELVKMVKEILEPVGKMDGDSLPVSAFADHVDGQFELGASAYEKRGVAVSVPTWDAAKCIQCNQCAYVCPHATIRPFALTAEEAKNAPEAAKIVDVKAGKGKGTYQFTMAISPLDCMGCGVCIGACPVNALSMVPQEGSELPQQDVFDYCVAKGRREEGYAGQHRQGQPVQAAHAGVLRLLRRLRRDQLCPSRHPAVRRPYVHLQRHRLLLHLGRSCGYLPPTAPTRRATAPHGATPCSRITPSTVWACSWARIRSARIWPTRPAS